MSNNTLKVKHEPGKRFHKILSVLSCLMKDGLAPMEIEIIAALKSKGCVLDTIVRKQICSELSISSDYLNNYIKKLRAKNVITGDSLNKTLRNIQPAGDDQSHVVAFMFEVRTETENERH